MTGVSATENNKDTDGIFVNHFYGLLGIQAVVAFLADRYQSALDIKVPGKLFYRKISKSWCMTVETIFTQGYLGIGAHDDIRSRLVNGQTLGLAILLPDTLHGKTTELDCFRRTSGRGTDCLVAGRSMPQIGKHGDATGVDDL